MDDGWLRGWKAIADYMGYSVRSVKKFYYNYRLPVLCNFGSVKALRSEIDEWVRESDKNCPKITRRFFSS